MDQIHIRKILERVQAKEISIAEALEKLKHLPYKDLNFAKIDHHRSLRKGFPEVVYCKGKTPAQVTAAIQELAAHHSRVLATKVNVETARAVQARFPAAQYYPEAQILVICETKPFPRWGRITIITAGTADIPVAEEAALTAELLENEVERIYDVGVAGIHRLFPYLPNLAETKVLVVIAGMDGVLPSLIAGLVDKPVIAVPSSTGYGANFQGLVPLLTMLNSCAPGIGVVNINNGFGAAVLAHLITRIEGKQE